MTEKQYIEIREERGTINISHAALAEIAALASLEVEGVAAMAHTASDKGVKGVSFTLDGAASCEIDAHILVKNGAALSDCAENVQAAIKNAVETSTGLTVSRANVFVAGIK